MTCWNPILATFKFWMSSFLNFNGISFCRMGDGERTYLAEVVQIMQHLAFIYGSAAQTDDHGLHCIY